MKKRHKKNITSNLPTKALSYITLPPQPRTQPGRAKSHIGNKQKLMHLALKGIFLGVFIGLTIYGIFYVESCSSISTSKAQTETFTELYFEDSVHLPSAVVPRHPYFFQFTLHNLEDKNMEYPYEVYIEVGQNKLIFDKGTVLLDKNASITIPENFATTSAWPRSEIVVDLVNMNQQIDFWIERSKQ